MEWRFRFLKKVLAQHGKRVTVFAEAKCDLLPFAQISRLSLSGS